MFHVGPTCTIFLFIQIMFDRTRVYWSVRDIFQFRHFAFWTGSNRITDAPGGSKSRTRPGSANKPPASAHNNSSISAYSSIKKSGLLQKSKYCSHLGFDFSILYTIFESELIEIARTTIKYVVTIVVFIVFQWRHCLHLAEVTKQRTPSQMYSHASAVTKSTRRTRTWTFTNPTVGRESWIDVQGG